jgi:hypothetical protein
LFAYKELGSEFGARTFLQDEPSLLRHEGFMVATVNPLSCDVVRPSALSDKRGTQVSTNGQS